MADQAFLEFFFASKLKSSVAIFKNRCHVWIFSSYKSPEYRSKKFTCFFRSSVALAFSLL